jgi:serine phosphatase RsbU (regulator of sigma subunit)
MPTRSKMTLTSKGLSILQQAFGVLAFLIAALSIADLYSPRPFDGIILDTDVPGARVVQAVVPGSGADRAGIRPTDVIVGIDRTILDPQIQAQELLNRHRLGESVAYLVRSRRSMFEVEVELGRRKIGGTTYIYVALLGFLFFVVGAFVVARQPRLPASRVFFTMCSLFMLFLVCRLRPASYSVVDKLVLDTGTMALLLLPAVFLHFFVIFPRPIWEWRRDPIAGSLGWIARISYNMLPVYLLPPIVYLSSHLWAMRTDSPLALINGAPMTNWWVMVGYVTLGLGALGLSSRYLPDPRQRRGAGLVFLGTLFGVAPLVVLAVGFPSFLNTERFLFYRVAPLVLVPITFAYAIIRFGLLDIRVILRKSLLYTVTTALVTAMYALGIASFNAIFRGTEIAASPYFPVIFALAIVLLFEPLRQRIQGPVDRFFFAERLRLQRAAVEMSETFSREPQIGHLVAQLTERLPALMGFHFTAIYLLHGQSLRRIAGPESLPAVLPVISVFLDHLTRKGPVLRLDELAPLRLLSPEVENVTSRLSSAGVDCYGLLVTDRRTVGIVLMSTFNELEKAELALLRMLFQQASVVLETNLLLEEYTHEAVLQNEIEIASSIQASLLPDGLAASDGWQLAAICRPAQEVGGDFFTKLPGRDDEEYVVVYGDVSGKSIPAALMMMAAREVLNSVALAHPEPEKRLHLANDRFYSLRGNSQQYDHRSRGIVALGYLGLGAGEGLLTYTLAGQPPPLVRRGSGTVECLEMPEHRLPLGALSIGGHRILEAWLEYGDLVVAYSDGVLNAQSPDGVSFGEDRLVQTLEQAPEDPQAVVNYVLEEIDAFTRGCPPVDDMTLLVVRWIGEKARSVSSQANHPSGK